MTSTGYMTSEYRTRTIPTGGKPASPAQFAFIARLAGEKAVPADVNIVPNNSRHASLIIDMMKALPRKAATPVIAPVAPAAVGYYVRNGEVFEVKANKAGTGTYAMRMVVRDSGTEHAKGTWTYAPGVGRDIAAEGLAPLLVEEAATLGLAHHCCMICGRTLTAGASIARGIGPICAGRL